MVAGWGHNRPMPGDCGQTLYKNAQHCYAIITGGRMGPKRPLATWLLSYILVPALAVIVSCAVREDTTVIRPNPIATAPVELPSAAVGSPQSGRPNIVL